MKTMVRIGDVTNFIYRLNERRVVIDDGQGKGVRSLTYQDLADLKAYYSNDLGETFSPCFK